jgi:hypothetical protein
MNIEVLLTEAELAEEFAESIEARDLPEKFFYWTPLSVKNWVPIAASGDDSVRPTWELLAEKAPDLTQAFGARVPIISFGSGNGSKDRMLLRSLAKANRETRYYPVDSSQTLLENACAGAEDDDCEVLGIKADISSPMHLILAADVSEAPRLFLLVGNTLSGFDPMDMIRHLAEVVKKGDILIVDTRLRSENPLQPSEDQKRFIFAPLTGAGVRAEDGDLEFMERPDERLEGMSLITRRFLPNRDLRLLAGTKEVAVARGERILLNFRYSFTVEAFRWLLTEHAGLRIVTEMPSPDGRNLTALCIKGDSSSN